LIFPVFSVALCFLTANFPPIFVTMFFPTVIDRADNLIDDYYAEVLKLVIPTSLSRFLSFFSFLFFD
jgi:hypothetical protein